MKIRITQDATEFKGLCSLLDESVVCTTLIPMVDYDKVFYYHDEQKKQIVACKITKVVIGNLDNWTRVFLVLNTPQGRRQVEYRKLRLFESPEDCINYSAGMGEPYYFTTHSLLHLFPKEIISWALRERQFWPLYQRCFMFDKGKVCNVAPTIHYLTFDKEGCNICPCSTYDGKKVYLSREECLLDNTKDIQIVGFDDDEPASADLMDTSNNHDPALVELINKAYREKPKDVWKIVRFLAERDSEFAILSKVDPRNACHDYCQHIADDKDLDTILNYCKI